MCIRDRLVAAGVRLGFRGDARQVECSGFVTGFGVLVGLQLRGWYGHGRLPKC